MIDFFKSIGDGFYQNFIEADRWKFLADGLLITLYVTACAAIIGVALGFLVGLIRANASRNGKKNILTFLCDIYVTVIRGTPVMVQLLIIYYVIFASARNLDPSVSAIICFGVNSGAYVSEIFRSGILSIDIGQTEAGRSLGLTSAQTMIRIVLPQAIKNALPALGNEMITLLKETSIVGTIGLVDLTKSYEIIQSRTLSVFWPLMAIAAIYLVIVMGLSKLLGILERRLRQSDKR